MRASWLSKNFSIARSELLSDHYSSELGFEKALKADVYVVLLNCMLESNVLIFEI